MQNKIRGIFRNWLPLAVVIAMANGLIYATAQQVLRQGANDPQIQLAEDGASALAQGAPTDSILPSGMVDLATSLAPFVMVWDDSGKLLAASGQLHGSAPEIPSGILDYARIHGEDRITWQPKTGVRIAAIFVHAQGGSGGFVMAGRSLREVEKREDQAKLFALLGMLTMWMVSLGIVAVTELWLSGKTEPHDLGGS
jgi:hypothetical protein